MLLGAGICSAQPANVAALQQAKLKATATFFDKAQSVDVRLAAIERMGFPETETFDRLLEVARDYTENDRVRLAAMKRYRFDDRYITTAIEIVANPATTGMLASELIYDIARRTTFRQPSEVRQTLQQALRARLDDSRDLVRLAAYRSLVSSHDMVAIDRLVEGVRDGNPPVPMADAIELLDVDGPTRHVQTVRPLLGTSDPDVQAQAVRVLAVDPDSRPAVVEIAANSGAPLAVRINALRALSREDAEYFSYALRLMANTKEHPDVRYAAIQGAMARMNYHQVPPDQQVLFSRAVANVASTSGAQMTSTGKNLGLEARLLLAHLRKYFPVIRRDAAIG
jgi:hypothetical protein